MSDSCLRRKNPLSRKKMSKYPPLPAFSLSSASKTKAEHRQTRTERNNKMQIPLIRLQCGVNGYDWGKIGKDSAAAKFGAATPSDFSIEEDKPYAEVCYALFLLA